MKPRTKGESNWHTEHIESVWSINSAKHNRINKRGMSKTRRVTDKALTEESTKQ